MSDSRKLDEVRQKLLDKGWKVKVKGMKEYYTHPEVNASVRVPSNPKSLKTIHEVEKAVARIEKQLDSNKRNSNNTEETDDMSNVAPFKGQEHRMNENERDQRLFNAEQAVKTLTNTVEEMKTMVINLGKELQETQRCILEAPKQEMTNKMSVDTMIAESLPGILRRLGIKGAVTAEPEKVQRRSIQRRPWAIENFSTMLPGQSKSLTLPGEDDNEHRNCTSAAATFCRSMGWKVSVVRRGAMLTVIRTS